MARRFDLPTVATATGLAAVAAVHAAWARGSTWPRRTDEELADLVVGKQPMPPRATSAGVAAALGGAAAAVAIAGHGAPDRRLTRLARLAALIAARVLRTRGMGGVAMAIAGSSTSGGDASEEFRRNDIRFYSPMCLALSVGAARAARKSQPEPAG